MKIIQTYSELHKYIPVYKKICVARWAIDNFFAHVNGRTLELNSQKFLLDGLSSRFYLNVLLFSDGSNRLSYYLHVHDMASEKSIHLDIKFWLEDDKAEKYAETPVKKAQFEHKGAFSGFPEFLKHADLHAKSAFFDDSPAIVCCEIVYHTFADQIEPLNIDKAVREGLWKSYQDGLYDGIIIKVENKQFKVSKTILAANSEVFENMLLTVNCKEVQTGTIEITDAKAVVIEALVEYMHRGDVKNLDSVAVELFKMADKYDVEPLKKLCAVAIAKLLNPENLFDVVVLAYRYSCEELKESVMHFLSANPNKGYFSNLTTKSEWFNFAAENDVLANEMLVDVYSRLDIKF